jgi:hypothetical protein
MLAMATMRNVAMTLHPRASAALPREPTIGVQLLMLRLEEEGMVVVVPADCEAHPVFAWASGTRPNCRETWEYDEALNGVVHVPWYAWATRPHPPPPPTTTTTPTTGQPQTIHQELSQDLWR